MQTLSQLCSKIPTEPLFSHIQWEKSWLKSEKFGVFIIWNMEKIACILLYLSPISLQLRKKSSYCCIWQKYFCYASWIMNWSNLHFLVFPLLLPLFSVCALFLLSEWPIFHGCEKIQNKQKSEITSFFIDIIPLNQ